MPAQTRPQGSAMVTATVREWHDEEGWGVLDAPEHARRSPQQWTGRLRLRVARQTAAVCSRTAARASLVSIMPLRTRTT
ncbi:hypothetical protein DD630_14235 [Streptomyces sp. BSE7F]|nr:hypothetical protein DD630_14235 [Streptomyces sp. BSE7F]